MRMIGPFASSIQFSMFSQTLIPTNEMAGAVHTPFIAVAVSKLPLEPFVRLQFQFGLHLLPLYSGIWISACCNPDL
jgi:hypothetical protein